MNIGNLCDRNVVIVGKQDTIVTAACLMRDHGVTELVVVDSCNGVNFPIGIISDRDIIVSVIAEGLNLRKAMIRDIVNNQFLTTSEDDDVMTSLRRLRHKGVRHSTVVSKDGGLVGIFSIDHVLDNLEEQLSLVNHILFLGRRKKTEKFSAIKNA